MQRLIPVTIRSSLRTPSPSLSLFRSSFHSSQKSLAPVIDASDADFAKVVIQASESKPIIVDFYADWCGPCKILKPILEKVITSPSYSTKTQLIKLNVDENMETAAAYQIMSLPTVAAFKDGKIVKSFVGVKDENGVKKFVEDVTREMM